MLNMKEAVIKAKSYAKELYADENIKDLSLEEIDFDDDAHKWKVTLGYNARRHQIETMANYRSNPTIGILGGLDMDNDQKTQVVREYKIFEIDANDGNLIKMIIRPL